jgi:ferredoxin-like protein FixX
VGVVKSRELIDSGPVGLVHTQEDRVQYEKPTCVSCVTCPLAMALMKHTLTVDSRCMSAHRGKADLAISLS